MKKICYITTISTTIRAFFVPQLKFLAKNGYDVTVICSPDDDLQSELGDQVKYIPVPIARGISPFTLHKSILKLIKVIKKEKFDLVQYSTPNAAFCAAIAARIANIKVCNYHLMGLRYIGMRGISRSIFRIIEKTTCKLSTHIECITKSNLDLCISEKLFNPDKATIIWNGSTGGVDMQRFDFGKRIMWRNQVRNALNIDENDFVFGFVGRITRDKGVNEILEAFSRLDEKCKLLIIGDREGLNTIDEKLWSYAEKNQNIIISDFVQDIERYYAAMDMLLLPSYREGFGMVIAEAAALGTPAIVSDIPGPIDVVKINKTAFIINAKNPDDLYKRMKYVLDNRNVCQAMAGECVNYIYDNFNSNILNQKILERKNNILNR